MALRHDGSPLAMIRSRHPKPLAILTAACLVLLWSAYYLWHYTSYPARPGAAVELAPPVAHVAPGNYSRVGKVTVAANTLDSPVVHRALRSHKVHNDLHGYRHFIGSREVVSELTESDVQGRPTGAWSKPAYLISVLVAELERPAHERLEWVFWFDADTVVTNPEIPLETFLPPARLNLSDVHLLLASNWDGLNSGAFAIRVHPWSVSLLSAVLAYPIYQRPLLQTDRFRDQSAFQWLLNVDNPQSPLANLPLRGRDRWVEVPMRWFNSFPFNNAFTLMGDWLYNHNMTDDLFEKGTLELYQDGMGGLVQPWKVMRGDMIVHFAGSNGVRDSWMGPWLDRVEANLPEWRNATKAGDLAKDVDAFWANTARDLNEGKRRMEEHQLAEAAKAAAAAAAAATTVTTPAVFAWPRRAAAGAEGGTT